MNEHMDIKLNLIYKEAEKDRKRLDKDELINEWGIYEKHKRRVSLTCGWEAKEDQDPDLFDKTMKKVTEILGV